MSMATLSFRWTFPARQQFSPLHICTRGWLLSPWLCFWVQGVLQTHVLNSISLLKSHVSGLHVNLIFKLSQFVAVMRLKWQICSKTSVPIGIKFVVCLVEYRISFHFFDLLISYENWQLYISPKLQFVSFC